MKILIKNLLTKSSVILLISIILLLWNNTNSLMLENNLRLSNKNSNKDKKVNSTEQSYLKPVIVTSLSDSNNEPNSIKSQNSFNEINISYNSNNKNDNNFRKLYDNYESVKTVNNNNVDFNSFINNASAKTQNNYNNALAQEKVTPKLISNHNMQIISKNDNFVPNLRSNNLLF